MVKIVSLLLTMLVNAAAGAFIFIILIVAMNGFHESDATWGIVAYIALAAACALLMGAAAFFAAGALQKRGHGPWAAGTAAVAVFAITGSVLTAVAAIIGVIVAEIARVNF